MSAPGDFAKSVRSHAIGAAMLTVAFLTAAAPSAHAQSQSSPVDDTIEAGEAEVEEPARKLVRWNEYDGRVFTIRLGAGLLYDAAAFSQDAGSEQQFDLPNDSKVRDFRLLLKGRFKFRRSVTWTCGLMYDGPTSKWLARETGVMIEVPELLGHVFVGRTKEGFSLNKVMVGYAGWTMERAPISDATIPILADGIKWLGYSPRVHVLWNLGFYGDWLSPKDRRSRRTNARSRDASRGCR
jgi:phosphate-selective porin OprO and OprP